MMYKVLQLQLHINVHRPVCIYMFNANCSTKEVCCCVVYSWQNHWYFSPNLTFIEISVGNRKGQNFKGHV